jgi:hypothetical protein
MPLPRIVKARLVSGRSVPVSIQGRAVRMRVGDEPIDIPFQVYRSHAWKMELVGDSLGQVQAAMQEGEAVVVAPTQVPQAEVAGVEEVKVEDDLPEWDLIVPPEDYLKIYGRKKKLSPTVKRRVELARKIVAKGKDGQAK